MLNAAESSGHQPHILSYSTPAETENFLIRMPVLNLHPAEKHGFDAATPGRTRLLHFINGSISVKSCIVVETGILIPAFAAADTARRFGEAIVSFPSKVW